MDTQIYFTAIKEVTDLHDSASSPGDNKNIQKSLRGSKGRFLQKESLGRRRHFFIFIVVLATESPTTEKNLVAGIESRYLDEILICFLFLTSLTMISESVRKLLFY
jgi:hypothetical protein